MFINQRIKLADTQRIQTASKIKGFGLGFLIYIYIYTAHILHQFMIFEAFSVLVMQTTGAESVTEF